MSEATTIDVFAGLPAIFRECCYAASIDSRFQLDAPFWRDGYLYATDGRVCVRREVPLPPPDPAAWTDPERRTLKRPGDIYPAGVGFGEPVAIPADIAPAPVECPRCKGVLSETCDNCGGDGLCNRCACDHEHECGQCGGTGRAKCYDCNGLGRLALGVDDSYAVTLGGLWFDRVILARLKAGGVTHLQVPDDPKQAARFVVGDCEGRVMPRLAPKGGAA